MRSFYSVGLPDEAKETLRPLLQRVRAPGLSVPRAEQLHFTLAFMGELPESELGALREAGTAAAKAVQPFELVLAGAGAFPNARRARVVWVGATDGGAELVRLAEALQAALKANAFAVEERKFKPHLTIARVKPGGARAAAAALQAVPAGELARIRVERLDLMQSVLSGRAGAVHTVRASFPL
jgi:2'-5' RNA ligase